MANYVLDYSGSQINTKLGNATTTSSGVMSAEDKIKLNGIEDEANKTLIDSTLTEEGQAADAKATGDAILDLSLITTEERTATSSIVTLENCPDKIPLKSCVVNIEPVQDLHGYENPWPAGGGKNVFQSFAETTTLSGVTFTANADGTITANGTADADIIYTLSKKDSSSPAQGYCRLSDLGVRADTSYVLNGDDAGVYNSTHWLQMLISGSGLEPVSASQDSTPFSFSESDISSKWYRLTIRVKSGTQLSNFVFKPMIRLASITDPTFAPYSNICPISGWTGANVTRTGFNVWDEEWEVGYLDGTGNPVPGNNDTIRSKKYIPVVGGRSYYFKVGSTWAQVCMYDAEKVYVGQFGTDAGTSNPKLLPSNVKYLKIRASVTYGTTYNHDICINLSDPAKNGTYEPGHVVTILISWQSEAGTVYGGTLDVTTGVLTVDREEYTFVGTEQYDIDEIAQSYDAFVTYLPFAVKGYNSNELLSNYGVWKHGGFYNDKVTVRQRGNDGDSRIYIGFPKSFGLDTVNKVKSYLSEHNLQVVAFLDSPSAPIQLTPTEVTTLLSQNNIWVDTGNVSITDGGYLTRVIEHADRLEESLGFYYDKDV